MSELKPCPFCGGDVDMLRAEVDKIGKVLYMPRCRECRAAILMKGQGEYTAYESAEAATTAWNTRHVETCKCTTDDSAWCFACSNCGKSFPRSELHLAHNHGEINYCPNCGRKVEG